MITTAADLDRLIPTQTQPGRSVAPDAPAPYEAGDIVAVFYHPFIGDECWTAGAVLECSRPDGARRFLCKVAIGNSTHSAVVIERTYAWEDGEGEGIIRLDYDNPGAHLKRLNDALKVPTPLAVPA